MITVIMPCWRRFENFEMVIQSWLNQPEVDQMIIWDNSGRFRTELPVLVISSNQNLGPYAKFNLARLAKNDLILYVDDDLIAKPGFVTDLLRYWAENKMVGIIGRRFTGESYYDSKACHARALEDSIRVDYLCGLVMLASRKHSLIDFGECPDAPEDGLEDIWWQQQLESVSLWVIPTKNYEHLPESWDENALHKRTSVQRSREEFYKKWAENGF